MLPSNFFNRLDPIYCEAILKLEQEIDELEATNQNGMNDSDKKIVALLNEFSSNFLMPKQLWPKIMNFPECVFHFCYLNMDERKRCYIRYLHDSKLYYCEDRKIPYRLKPELSIDNFLFPHAKLEKKWKRYEFTTTCLIPRSVCKRYEKMKKLYLKIKVVKNNIEKWFEALMEAEDVEFVEQNVEFRLGQCLTNKKLWKLYIDYLKNHDHQKLLQTYSKYCRFFVSDTEIKEEYQKAAEKHGPSVVPWKNTFDFEIYNRESLKLNPPKSVETPKTPSKCLFHFNPRTTSPQNFPFRRTLINYIIKNAEASILHDLFKSCKWFYFHYPIAIIYHFFGTKWDQKIISGQKVRTDCLGYPEMNSKHFYFANIFNFDFHRPDLKALSGLIPKIHRFTAHRIHINGQNLSPKEVEFFLGHGEVTDLNLRIKDQDGNPFLFEDILQFIPKIQELDLLYTVISPNIAETLCNFPFKNKIQRMWIGDIPILPDPHTFAEFLLKHSKKNYRSRFTFFGYFNDETKKEEKRADAIRFENIVILAVYKKWKGYILPELHI